ncbi:hypothetical protein WJX75_006597 [Coccomyxa subellipsoidea]|uniref:Uncharacterized protein n=1 Tax=Coccomyxa subellipsoidea TaxID=248742 RepID=A0ABR2Z155_9CHLO
MKPKSKPVFGDAQRRETNDRLLPSTWDCKPGGTLSNKRMRRFIISATFLIVGFLSAAAFDSSDLEVYPGRSLLHDHDDHKTDYGCQCKNANWYCYGYCNIGTTSGDSQGCIHDCLVCCGWGGAPASSPPPADMQPMATPDATPAAAAAPAAAPAAPADQQPADTQQTPAAPKTPAAPAGLTKSTSASPPIRVVNSGRRLQQKSSPPPSSPSGGGWGGNKGGDWHGDGHKDGGDWGHKDDGHKDPNQCWNSFWSKYPWKK